MRLRNIPRADSVLNECKEVVKNGAEYRGRWREVFGNSNPVHIEIGMGKGRFLMDMAKIPSSPFILAFILGPSPNRIQRLIILE